MKELFYYSIFAIVLYFVLTQVFENFSLEQENFDPSLVPVSSIVTLAKVAQKLVNGNGVLTNPGSLQIGTPTVPGNLTVTGNILLGGVGTDGFMLVKETSNYACLRAPGSPANGGGNRLCFSKDHGVVNFNNDGSLALAGALNVPGNTTVTGNLNARSGTALNTRVGGIWTTAGVYAEAGTAGLELGAANKQIYIGAANGVDNQNLTVTGTATVKGNIVSSSSIAAIAPGSTASTMSHPVGSVVSSMDTAGFLMLWGSNAALIGDSRYPIRFGTGTNTAAAGFSEYGRFDTSGHFNIGGNGYPSRNLIVSGNANVSGTMFMSNDRWQKSNDGKNRLHFTTNSDTIYGSGNGNHYFRTGADGNTPNGMVLDSSSNLSIAGSLNIGGNLKFNGQPAMIVKDFKYDGSWVNKNTGVGGPYQASFGWLSTNSSLYEYWNNTLWFDGTWRFTITNALHSTNYADRMQNVRIYFFHNNLF